MTDPLDSLILDLLEWLGSEPKPHAVVLDAWRTSCPRLTVWEDANDRGFVACRSEEGHGTVVCRTTLGQEFLERHRRGATRSGR
jgi:hypothetical protein